MFEIKHGKRDHPLYETWKGMRARCNNKGHTAYKNYGGRGIRVCERWDDFEAFAEDMGEKPTSSHTLDRVDNTGDYSPDNCRWATRREQSKNSRRIREIEFQGETKSIAEWARALGMKPRTLERRINRSGWTIERALTTKVGDDKWHKK